MPDYRRNRIPGAAYFFTVNLLDRHSGLLVTQIDGLREAVRRTRLQSPVTALAECAALFHPMPLRP
ncbi:MAG TPA: hypothetical protein VGS13_12850 [Stellaceae bacterium]|nr:hypothetical protein [Stellaceae bacterium]